MNRPKTALITLTNHGYLDYTINCALSLKKIGFDSFLKIYSIGKEANDALRRKGFDSELIDDEEHTQFQKFRKGRWANVTYYKFEIIHENLQRHDFVCFTDGDIVFEDVNFLQYCLDNIGDDDLLIQNDTCDDDDDSRLCSGFIFVRSNARTKALFDPDEARSDIALGWDDQVHINRRKHTVKYRMLPLALFPNGRHFRNNNGTIDPYLIHFNYIFGHKKAYDIIKFGKWQSLYCLFRFILLSRPVVLNEVKKRARKIFAN